MLHRRRGLGMMVYTRFLQGRSKPSAYFSQRCLSQSAVPLHLKTPLSREATARAPTTSLYWDHLAPSNDTARSEFPESLIAYPHMALQRPRSFEKPSSLRPRPTPQSSISHPTPPQLPLPTLAPGTIMHNLMRKDITVNAKHPPTRLALVPPTLTHVILALALPPPAPTTAFPPPLTPPPSERRTHPFLLTLCRWRRRWLRDRLRL